jgi:hypothetical protein
VNGRADDLKILVERQHKCRARHVESVIVRERYEGMRVWDGVVETFQLDGHPEAKRAYAWVVPASKPQDLDYKVVLGLPPVNSAHDAVRVVITSEFRPLADLARKIIEEHKK